MRKQMRMAGLALLAISFASAAQAEDTTTTPATDSTYAETAPTQPSQTTTTEGASSGAQKVSGSVVSIDAARNEITVKDDATGSNQTIRALNPSALATIKEGDKVSITLSGDTSNAQIMAKKS